MTPTRLWLAFAALTALLLVTAGGCDTPREGGSCTPGSYSSHTDGGKTTELACGADGIWRKT